MPGLTHHMLVSIATGLILLGSTAALAEQKDATVADPNVQRTDVRTSHPTGGFYASKDKDDNWYYDFYETRSAGEEGEPLPEVAHLIDRECRVELEKLCEGVEPGSGRIRRCFDLNEGKLTPSCRTQVYDHFNETAAVMAAAALTPRKEGESKSNIEPKSKIEAKNKIRPDAIRTSEKTVFVDAATHVHAPSSHRQIQESAFKGYYDDPWYYEERDASYTMTSKPAPDDQPRPMVKGSVTRVKQVRNAIHGGQNTVVQIKPAKGDLRIIDLGPTLPLLDMALIPGDAIAVDGPTKQIGPYSVLMADHVKHGANAVTVVRADTGVGQARKEAVGRLDRIMEVPIRGTGEKHNVAAIKSETGLMLVDLGPTTTGNIPAGTAPGDQIIASGPVATVGNYPVLFAERVSVANAPSIKVARPDGYPGASRQDMEASQTLQSPSTQQPQSR